MSWKISTNEKKSVIEHEIFVKDGVSIIHTVGWRWGWVVVSEDPQISNPDDNDTLIVSDFSIEDQSFEDGCWDEWDFGDLSESEIEQVTAAWDEDWHEGLEKLGWEHYETEIVFRGPLEITKDEVEPPSEEQPVATSKGWPF